MESIHPEDIISALVRNRARILPNTDTQEFALDAQLNMKDVDWTALSSIALERAYSELRLLWTTAAIGIYEDLGSDGSDVYYNPQVVSAMQLRAYALNHLHAFMEDMLSPKKIEDWLFNTLDISYDEAIALINSIEPEPYRAEQRSVLTRLRKMKNCINILRSLEPLSRWPGLEQFQPWLDLWERMP